MTECTTPITRAMVKNELDYHHIIELCYQNAINFTDDIYGNKNQIKKFYKEDEIDEILKERLIFYDKTLNYLYNQAMKECDKCVKRCSE